jgi:hypothetical protein
VILATYITERVVNAVEGMWSTRDNRLAAATFGLAVFAALAARARVGGVTDSDTTRRPAWSPPPRDGS